MWQSWTPKNHSRLPRKIALPRDSVPTMVMTKASVGPVVSEKMHVAPTGLLTVSSAHTGLYLGTVTMQERDSGVSS